MGAPAGQGVPPFAFRTRRERGEKDMEAVGVQEQGNREPGAEQHQPFQCQVFIYPKVGEVFTWVGEEMAVSEAGAAWKAIRDAKTALKAERGRKQVVRVTAEIRKVPA